MSKLRTLILSPYRGDRDLHLRYLAACMHDSLQRGEAPFASHGMYPWFLDDNDPDHRQLGMECELAWGDRAELVAVYVDLGRSEGMIDTFYELSERGISVDVRRLGPDWEEHHVYFGNRSGLTPRWASSG